MHPLMYGSRRVTVRDVEVERAYTPEDVVQLMCGMAWLPRTSSRTTVT
ncbi:hypothetical protein [Nocardia miyunensis]|nr:hypothetical protein [Nocardia miyunensis]